ncbi:MAG: prepilin-type N-terminal cleavage/methylation domain-containing protein [Oscillospiraceae bacterium]|nr:prepilin-type N-terminal cleavage/methylation domain-containing protein [Oscillospiraceae bacterium]
MRKVKGFTLIECLVALLILGVSSLLLVQGYTQLMKMTKKNNTRYLSVAEQMANAESKNDDDETYAKILTGTKITGDTYSSSEGRTFTIQKAKKTGTDSYSTSGVTGGGTYKINVNVYATNAYEYKNVQDKDIADTSRGTDTRYIYFHR